MTRNNRSATFSRSLVVVSTALVVALASGVTWAQNENEAPAAGNRADGTVIARTDPGGNDFDARLVAGSLATRDDYGYAIVTADFNGDGFDDWAVGYPASDEVRVYFGGLHRPYADPNETDANPTSSPSAAAEVNPTILSGPAGSHFGHALAAGNVDGSGLPELIVGAPGTNDRAAVSPDPGQAYVVRDVSANLQCTAASGPGDDCERLPRDVDDERDGDHFGWSVAVIPLPGNPTIAVGAPRWYDTDPNGPIQGRVEFFRDVNDAVADATGETDPDEVAEVADPDDRARLSRLSSRSARASATRFSGSRRFTARGRQGPGRDPFAPPFDGALAPSFSADGSIIDPGGAGTDEFGEQLGESMTVCTEGAVLRLAVGAVAADAVRVLNPDNGATVSTVLDPDLADIDAVDRPRGLFGSNVVCGNFNADPGDELVVAAVLRDWALSFYGDAPRANGGGVFLFDTLSSPSPALRLLPQSSGEFLGYALAAGRVFTSVANPPSSDPYDALLVGSPRFDDLAGPVPGAPVCDLDYANGSVMMLDLTNAPADPVVLTEANIADGALNGFVRHRVIGTRCGQAGGAIAVGDLNNDGWADVVTSTNVDPNEDFLRPGQNPPGNAWIFSMNDADIDEGADGANVVDADDDNDCFADAWEDRNADGQRDADETGPFTPDINAVVSGLQVACGAGGACEPGEQLNISMQLNRSCIAIDDDRVADGASNRARVTLTIDGGGQPISDDLSLVSTVPAGGVENDTDPNSQVVRIEVLESDLTFPTALTASAALDIVSPVDAAFPDDLDIDVLVEVLDGSDAVILEARGTFGGNLVGRLDDNVDGPVNQAIDATPAPGVVLTEAACEFGNPRQAVACLPNAIIPGLADLFNDGLKNLPADFGLAVEFTTAGFATDNTFRCPGGVAAGCFPNAGVDCTGTSQDGDSATCVVGQQLLGATSSASPALTSAIELEILDDPNLGDATEWPASVIAQTRIDPAGGGSVPDAAAPAIPVARPKASMTVECEAPCSNGKAATFRLDIQNVGAAGSGPATVLFAVPESTCDADQDPLPAPAPGTCRGVAGASSPAVGLSCDAIQSINGVVVIPCTFDETTPSNAPPITIEFDLTVTDARLDETGSATVLYPQCADNATCPDAGTVVSRSADATLPLQAPFIAGVGVTCESGDCLPNGGVTYEIEIRNSAATPADTTVLVPIPAGTICVGACFGNVGTGDSVSCVRSNTPDRLECAVDSTRRTNPTTFDVNLTIADPPGVADFTADVELYLPQCTGAACDAATPIDSTTETLPIVTAELTIEKSALPTTYSAVDEVIAYSYLVTNTGDVTITGPITIDDDTTTDEACPAGDLAPAATTTCTSSYTITQADLDSGSVTNVASASGTDPVGNTITSATDTVTVTAVPDPELTVVKSANPTVFELAGEVIAYSYEVTNTGNVTISGPITIDDDKTVDEACPAGDLAPGASLTCTSSYTILAADVTAGSVTNVASASGTDPDTNPVTSATDTVTINIAAPAMSVVKSSTTATLSAPGTVDYSYLVTNTGNVDLAGISLSDDNDNDDMSCPANALAVGANMTCTATHTFTQAELDANGSPTPGSGVLSNTVTAVSNKAPNATDSLSIPITQTPGLTVVKSVTQGSYSTVGDVLDYSFEVTNSGNVTITGPITIDDDKATDESCPAGDLAPGANLTCTASYTVTQADLDAGSVTNVASASGTDPNAATVTSPTDSETVNAVQNAALSMVKTATQATYSAVGDVLDYTYDVTNDGNVTITGPITIDDDRSTDESCPAGDLAPGGAVQCTATYTITQADLDAGSVTNTASASGTDPNAATVTSPTDSETVNAIQSPSLSMVKTALQASFAAVGDVLDYTFDVTNTGNVTITGPITIDDDKSADESCPAGDLAPGDTVQCTATYTIVQADVDATSVTNVASASGTDPNAATVTSPTDSETVPLGP